MKEDARETSRVRDISIRIGIGDVDCDDVRVRVRVGVATRIQHATCNMQNTVHHSVVMQMRETHKR
jgi:hypothetical protein